MKFLKYPIYLILIIAIAASAWFLYRTIGDPIQERKQFEIRSEQVKIKLENIAEAQKAYYDVHGEYAGNWNDLKKTILEGKMMELQQVGDPYDTTVVMRIDTNYVPVLDKVEFEGDFNIASMNKVPFAEKNFRIVEQKRVFNDIQVSVFEVSVRNDVFLTDLLESGFTFSYDKTLLKDSLMVGSLSKQISTGNWQ
jgi:hypothetical protein